MAIPCLNIPNAVSSFLIIIIVGDYSQNTASAVEINHENDGEQFVKSIVHGQKPSGNLRMLLFTAPYRLCKGGCSEKKNNYAMVFPLYVGKEGMEEYKKLYPRDFKEIHSEKPYAPFVKRTTRHPFTLCPSKTKAKKSS